MCVCVCVRACVRACVRVCVRVCVVLLYFVLHNAKLLPPDGHTSKSEAYSRIRKYNGGFKSRFLVTFAVGVWGRGGGGARRRRGGDPNRNGLNIYPRHEMQA